LRYRRNKVIGVRRIKTDRIYNFGIIGAGNVSKIHAQAIKEIEKGRLLAVCSKNIDKARALATDFQVDHIYTDYHQMLQRDDVDIVCILTPNSMHTEIGIAAAQAGKHVIVEKPIDISLDKADALINACRKNKVKLGVISQHRFDVSTQFLKDAVAQGQLGKLILGDAHIKWYRSQDYYDSGAWRGTWGMDGGGVLINQGIHTIDLLLHIMGDVESVYGYCSTLGHERIEVEDMATATLKFKNGALGTIIGSSCVYPGLPARLEVHGTKGSARIEGDQLVLFEVGQGDNGAVKQGIQVETGASDPMAIDSMAHKLQIQDMIDAIEEDREPLVTGEEGRKALALILAIYESAKTGKPVKL
jgi:predicted dehydrogenase